MMAAVLIVALGLAALRNASETWACATFLATCGPLPRDRRRRLPRRIRAPWWLGFALFGWGYLLLAFWSSVELPTMALLDAVGSRLGVKFQFSGGMGGMGGGMWSRGPQFGGMMGGGPAGLPDQSIQQIAHCLWALLAALLGGLLAATFFGGPRKRRATGTTAAQVIAESAVRWWLWPSVLWLAGCALSLFSAHSPHGRADGSGQRDVPSHVRPARDRRPGCRER